MTEYLDIDPLEQICKAIGVVHGPTAERRVRLLVAALEAASQRALNAVPWTAERIRYVLDNEVRYKDWKFIVDEREVILKEPETTESGERFANAQIDLRLRAEWIAPDMITGLPDKQQSRWWPLSVHMCKTEIIQTVFLCVLKAEEHEIREAFKYKDKAPFHSHIDIDTLAASSDNVDVRIDTRPDAPANQRRE